MNSVEYSKHSTINLEILNDIYTDESIADDFGFTGGTASTLFHRLPRYSLELELTHIGSNSSHTSQEKLHHVVSKYGRVSHEQKTQDITSLKISRGLLEHKIAIEINENPTDSSYETRNLLGVRIPVMVSNDIFAYKIIDLYKNSDKKGRNLFDVHEFFSSELPYNTDIINNLSNQSVKHVLEKCIDNIREIDEDDIFSDLKLVIAKEKMAFAQYEMKDKTIAYIEQSLLNWQ